MDTRTCPPCTGDCNQGRECSSRQLFVHMSSEMRSNVFEGASFEAVGERQEPLPTPFSAEEYMQKMPQPWACLNLALAIVCAIMIGVLVVHAAARAGWL